jgi:hypothetical protein
MHTEPVERIHRISYGAGILVRLNDVDQTLGQVLRSCSRRRCRVRAKHDERPERILAHA